jgi:adenine deaminase
VFTQRVEQANVLLVDGWIAGVGHHDWLAHQTLDLAGRAVLPGFLDAHMHLESTLLTPGELARLLVPHGTTGIISDSHEIGNVLGIPGIDLLHAASAGLPLDLFFTASSCVPATHWEHTGAVLGPAEVRDLLNRPSMVALAEVMDIPAVLGAERGVLEKIEAAQSRHRTVDGHAPGLSGLDLQAYVAAGIHSDHESATAAEARAKAGLGMLVQVREGSSARNLDALLPLLAADELGDSWCLVTDDIFPDDLRRDGHLDGLLRRVVAGGVTAASAVRHATLVPARHYGLLDRGAVVPGYRADLVIVDNLRDFHPHLVLKGGQIVAREGKYGAGDRRPPLPHGNTVHVAPLDGSAFRLRLSRESFPVIRIVPGQIVTRAETQRICRKDGWWVFDPEHDVALIASIERHRASGGVGLGLVSGFGFRRAGALGSSVAHDSHNLIIAGTNLEDMLACVQALQETGGGFVAASGGTIRARLPLPVAGLLSTEDADTVCRQLREVRDAAQALGCELAAPFGTLSFLALPVIPELRITDQGVFDVRTQQFVSS